MYIESSSKDYEYIVPVFFSTCLYVQKTDIITQLRTIQLEVIRCIRSFPSPLPCLKCVNECSFSAILNYNITSIDSEKKVSQSYVIFSYFTLYFLIFSSKLHYSKSKICLLHVFVNFGKKKTQLISNLKI